LPKAPVRLIACSMGKNVNQGGLLRLADAFRLERVDLTPEPDDAVDLTGSQGTRIWQPHRWVPAPQAVAEASGEGYQVAALTLTPGAMPLERVSWRFPLALVLGQELEGVPEHVETECDVAVAIPLYGLITSLNVVCAAAIVLHHALERYRRDNPEFEPVRASSRRLLGLAPLEF
jgi:23S rRNA (guanosine2251-2'-O)-methyltransferase